MKPEAGQWWFPNNAKPGESAEYGGVYIVGSATNGHVVYQGHSDGHFHIDEEDLAGWHHEPRCTGWDWIVPQPQPAEDPDEWVVLDPVKYADHVPRVGIDQFEYRSNDWVTQKPYHSQITVGRYHECCAGLHRCRRRDLPKAEQLEQWPKYWTTVDSDVFAFVKQLTANECQCVWRDGTHGPVVKFTNGNERRELTEAEAMALLKKPEHLPDASKKVSDEALELIVHLRDQMEALSKRVAECERLLKKPEPQPQKTRVRLWSCDTDGVVVAEDNCPAPGWVEIHHDAEGFYTID